MNRLSLIAIALIAICSCAQIKVPSIPLAKTEVDPNLSQFDARFKGPAAGLSNIAESTPKSAQLQKKALGIAHNPQIDTYLNAILAKLQKSLPGTPPAARVHATPNTEFNATSYQDGGIYIPYKVLETLESEDELASLIAHEYAHVLLEHHKTNWINSAATLAFSAGSIYISREIKTATQENLLGMMLANNATLGVSQIGLMPALTRSQEEKADQLGTDLLIKANYSFIGGLSLLSRMQSWEARNQAILEKRKTNYIDLFKKSESSFIARAIDGQLDVLENKIAGLIRDTSTHHEKSDDRSKLLRSYIKKYYAETERPALSEAHFTKAIKSHHAKEFFSGIDLAHTSTEALQQRDFSQAMAYASAAENSPARRVPFARHVLVNAMTMTGRQKDAMAMLEGDVGSGDALFVDNMMLLNVLKKSHPEQALAIAQRSYDRYEDSPELLPELILLNKQMKNEFSKMKFYSICAGKAMSTANNSLLENCNKAKG